MNMYRAIAFAFTLVTLCAPARAQQPPAHAGAAIAVQSPWARATPPAAPTGAIYFTLHNAGPGDDRLIAASTPAAKKAELHTHLMEGDIMRMREVASVPVPAGKDVRFVPGGYHVMLMGLNHPLKQGDKVELTLTFEKAGKITVSAPIMAAGAMGPNAGKGMDGHGSGMGGMGH